MFTPEFELISLLWFNVALRRIPSFFIDIQININILVHWNASNYVRVTRYLFRLLQ